ncbi:nucleoside hydrolase [Amycolatopsis jejuensis]|uniref:nucleoside hydrolase n=1 Tax=Amycolatopsis jejuensis TaxID=330084 RepID=UPI0005273B05|nr:nucleoside hydrolase [Amycolatopsis jejuensis]
MNSTPVVLDVDTGIDDALAIMLALRHPALDVRAITCVAGNAGLGQVVENTLAVTALAGNTTVPVAAGMPHPIVEPPRDASYVHGRNGLAGLTLPPHNRQVEDCHAVEYLRRLLTEAPVPVTIIALAPLTNIAMLLRMYPEAATNIARIVFMGGAIGLGNATASAEFNVWHDPEAAEIVLRSGVPATMYGLEPFYRVTCDADTIAKLSAAESPLQATAGALLAHLATVGDDQGRTGEKGAAAIGDAGTVCAVIDPDGAVVRRAPVSVALQGPETRGRTIVDFRRGASDGQVDIVIDVDGPRYRDLFLDTLS